MSDKAQTENEKTGASAKEKAAVVVKTGIIGFAIVGFAATVAMAAGKLVRA